MNTSLLHAAIGRREGDSLDISNQWAKVTIVYSKETLIKGKYVSGWTVSGDVVERNAPGAGLRNVELTFRTLSKAMDCAVFSLAEFQCGRAD